jgi:ABC-type phosphonate transport system ATPase subunit
MTAGTLPAGLHHSTGELEQLPVIALERVTKHYRGGGGVDEVTFEVHGGEVFRFLGPKGSPQNNSVVTALGA